MAGPGRFANVAAPNPPDQRGEGAAGLDRAASPPFLIQAVHRDGFFTEEMLREFFEQANDPETQWCGAGHRPDGATCNGCIAWPGGYLSLEQQETDHYGSTPCCYKTISLL
ncbi:MAG: hypothetical protein WCY70_00795 [Methanoculleus sp.]